MRKRLEILDSVKKADAGKGVIVLEICLVEPRQILQFLLWIAKKLKLYENLPMLIKMMSIRDKSHRRDNSNFTRITEIYKCCFSIF